MGTKSFEDSLMVNETVDATVVFIDICGFTSITETQPADTVVSMLNTYFDVMVKEIIAQKGYIDKFIGDAILAVFRGEYHLDRAIDACLSLRNLINALPNINEAVNFKPELSIGINSGELVSGNIGSSTLRRLDYTVVGDVVNTAARLQSVATAGQILIPQSAFEKVKNSFSCKSIGEYLLKNKQFPVSLYEVIE
jgi:class 3 adenylate cyclase